MVLDYDLVIIGGTVAGRKAAITTALTGARVALVESGDQVAQRLTGQLLRQGLLQSGAADWKALKAWVEAATQRQDALLSLASLGIQGVDVVVGPGEFGTGPRPDLPIFSVQDRTLRAQHYLIVSGSQPRLPAIEGLTSEQVITPTDLMGQADPPQHIALIGNQGSAMEWAVALANFDIQVTLIQDSDRFLSAADCDIQRLVRHQLVALGIQLIPQSTVTHIKAGTTRHFSIEGSQNSLEIDAILLTDVTKPNVAQLSLNQVGVSCHQRGLWVNPYLQTSHPRIYAAGAVLGGEDLPELAEQEIQVAIHNALFWPRRSMTYHHTTYGLVGLDEIGQTGLTEQQARQIYGEDLQIFQSAATPVTQKTPYSLQFCKLIVRNNWRLLGVHGIGEGAREWVGAIAPFMKGGITLEALAKQPASPHTLAAVIQATANQAIQSRWTPGHWRRDWAENWFNWRRSRF
jgi:pyruvate/2-oxoglutarate dehydrogenase complex dihydrolipoamide dehydrogenase (E3) component